MNDPSADDLQFRMSRVVPAGMLNDPDFKQVLKEKARTSAPSETETESSAAASLSASSVSTPATQSTQTRTPPRTSRHRKRSAKASSGAARIVDPYDPNMIPDIERRLRDRRENREEAARLYRQDAGAPPTALPPPPEPSFIESLNPLEILKSWKFYAVVFVAVLVMVIMVRRGSMVRRLGISYALAAELPVLLPLWSILGGVPAQQMQGEVRQFRLGVHPLQLSSCLPDDDNAKATATTPGATHEPQVTEVTPPDPHQQHLEHVNLIVDEAVQYAAEARGEAAPPPDSTNVPGEERYQDDDDQEPQVTSHTTAPSIPLPDSDDESASDEPVTEDADERPPTPKPQPPPRPLRQPRTKRQPPAPRTYTPRTRPTRNAAKAIAAPSTKSPPRVVRLDLDADDDADDKDKTEDADKNEDKDKVEDEPTTTSNDTQE